MEKPAKKRVLIVDDAVVMRKMLSDALTRDPALEVAGTASNGRFALAKFPALKPDIILLDIEMPEMDGLETVRQLRKLDARIPIIMFSTLTEHGASATLEALALGATDYVTKPSNRDVAETLETVSRELIPRIHALCHLPAACAVVVPKSPAPSARLWRPPSLAPVQVVAIGVSTGGPDALARLLPSLPVDLPVPVLIAQHMPPIFTALLAARLSAKSAIPVRECVSGEPLQPGCAVLAPGDFHMVVSKEDVTRLRVHQDARENYCRPSVDVLFRSVAQVYGGRSLAVILTGMGQDGLKGCESLRALGARVCVQDEASSVVWGMPGFVARSGLADKILPLDQIAAEIVRATTLQAAARSHS
ncbi:MAG TPA: chemotaxis response regulator protein-glutamate methylesterase [Candidatus Sulfotelmatobacter sp.]|jgi:two-component system chemotaxis response regulator CheB|nr:chemotaxis response regulator protein-glutamate methylesterase [Candidatus Sulfotelmatobacter sp.]